MTMLVPNGGEVVALSYLVNKVATPENLVMFLFATNITPAETDTIGTYTEAAGGGYASKTLTGASWTVTGGAPSLATYAAQLWTFTGPLTTNGTIFGYGYKRLTTGDLVAVEAFASMTPTTSGDNLTVTPSISAD